jgi:hypothetical protein
MNGNMVRNAINIATVSTLNHINASNINEITGVDLIVTNMGFKKALNELLIPARIPSPTPKIKDIAKPASPLKIVAEIINKNPFELKSLIVVIKVDSGEGKINSEL